MLLFPITAPAQLTSAHDATRGELGAQAEANDKQAIVDRHELVVPAAKGFRPESKASKIRLHLILEKTEIRLGETIRYRLEITSVGSKPYVFNESNPSFFKSGRLPNDRIRLILKGPDGHEADVLSPIKMGDDLGGKEVEFPSNWSETKKSDSIDSTRARSRAAGSLYVKLLPGETLRTRGDAPGDAFRSLLARRAISEPGIYELRAVLDGLLKVGMPSNAVRLTVLR